MRKKFFLYINIFLTRSISTSSFDWGYKRGINWWDCHFSWKVNFDLLINQLEFQMAICRSNFHLKALSERVYCAVHCWTSPIESNGSRWDTAFNQSPSELNVFYCILSYYYVFVGGKEMESYWTGRIRNVSQCAPFNYIRITLKIVKWTERLCYSCLYNNIMTNEYILN